jgi:hypothetical protein
MKSLGDSVLLLASEFRSDHGSVIEPEPKLPAVQINRADFAAQFQTLSMVLAFFRSALFAGHRQNSRSIGRDAPIPP